MNCRDFLIEFEERKALTKAAALHLNSCASCKKMSAEQTRVWQMIDGFERVDVPKDFDFRLKARIANAKPGNFQPRFLPVLRYVLPLSIVVLIFAFVAFNGVSFLGNNEAPQTAKNFPPKQNEIVSPQNSFQANEVAQTGTTKDLPEEKPFIEVSNSVQERPTDRDVQKTSDKNVRDAAIKSERKFQAIPQKDNSKSDLGVGSHDLGVGSSNVSIAPKGINSNKTLETSPNYDKGSSVTTDQILKELGMEIVSENGNRRVKSIKQNSLAERSGIKAGDVIKSINGRKLMGEEARGKTIEVKRLTIKRGTEEKEVVLH